MSTLKKKNQSGRRSLGPEFWQDEVNSFRSSHLSQADYCRQKDLKLSAFGYWNRKLQGENLKPGLGKKKSRQTDTGFIEISEIVKASNQSHFVTTPRIEVELKNGWQIRVPADLNQETLRTIFMVLKESE